MNKKILIDVNIFEDVLADRSGSLTSSEIIGLVKKNLVEGWISANSIGILYYLRRKFLSEEESRKKIQEMIKGFSIIPLRNNIVNNSFNSVLLDFEDNIQIESAFQFNLNAIITRNKKDYLNSRVPAFTPEEFLADYSSKPETKSVSFLDLKAQLKDVYNDIDDEITGIISNTSFVLGKSVSNFESEFAEAHNAKYCFGVSTGTAGNHLVLWALGIGPGDEVIIPANTFIATAWGATLCGATPVFVDCHTESYNLDPSKVEAAITSKTKVIVAVHLYGQPAEMDSLNLIANRHKLFLVEDCAQAHISTYKGRAVGSLASASSFSFYPGKNLGAYGEGGAVMTDNDELAKKFKMIRDHGMEKKYYHEMYGHNYRMEGIQGAVLGVKLRHLEDWTNGRRRVAAKYCELLKNIDGIILPKEMDYARHVYHLFVIQVESKKEKGKSVRRDQLQKYLNENGISTGLHYPIPLHLQPCFEHLGYKNGDFPVAEELAEQGLSLPMYAEMADEQINFISEKIHEYFTL